jgi:hypothetical protein
MIEIGPQNGVVNSVVDLSKNSHDVYVSKLKTDQVRAAIQDLRLDFVKSYSCWNMKIFRIRRSRVSLTVPSKP